MRAAVVGGSLGGLTAALVLRDLGLDVTVFERSSPAMEGRGAGITLHPVSERYLVTHGLARLDEFSTSVSWLRYISTDGSVLHQSRCGYRFTSWSALYRPLLEELGSASYRHGRTLIGIALGKDWAQADFADGSRAQVDLLVCADGISSTARSLLLPEVQPRYAGYLAWRGTVPERDLSPRTQAAVGDCMNFYLMPDGHVVSYPIPGPDGSAAVGCRLINFVWYRNVASELALDGVMTDRDGSRRQLSVSPGAVREGYVEEVRAAAEALPPALAEVVRTTNAPFVQVVMDLEVPAMRFGRACLLGDAAFTARPHAAVGTAKAAADAWSLAEELRRASWDVPAALTRWEVRELALGRSLVDRARRMGDGFQFGGRWRPGDPELRFGLYRPGDSEERTASSAAGSSGR